MILRQVDIRVDCSNDIIVDIDKNDKRLDSLAEVISNSEDSNIFDEITIENKDSSNQIKFKLDIQDDSINLYGVSKSILNSIDLDNIGEDLEKVTEELESKFGPVEITVISSEDLDDDDLEDYEDYLEYEDCLDYEVEPDNVIDSLGMFLGTNLAVSDGTLCKIVNTLNDLIISIMDSEENKDYSIKIIEKGYKSDCYMKLVIVAYNINEKVGESIGDALDNILVDIEDLRGDAANDLEVILGEIETVMENIMTYDKSELVELTDKLKQITEIMVE